MNVRSCNYPRAFAWVTRHTRPHFFVLETHTSTLVIAHKWIIYNFIQFFQMRKIRERNYFHYMYFTDQSRTFLCKHRSRPYCAWPSIIYSSFDYVQLLPPFQIIICLIFSTLNLITCLNYSKKSYANIVKFKLFLKNFLLIKQATTKEMLFCTIF